jgi:glycopeptide antibiotics resistance protein
VTGRADLRIPRSTHEEPSSPSAPDASGRGRPAALFVVYLVLLVWIVLWKLEVPYVGEGALRRIKLIPFAPTTEDGASEPFEVIANVVLFVPFGVYLGLTAPSLPWWRLAAVVAGSSLTLEVVQYVLAVGSTDSTDLVVNTAGGLAGLGLLALARRRFGHRTGTVMTRVCALGTALLLLAVVAFIASPLHFAPLRNVHVPIGAAPGVA